MAMTKCKECKKEVSTSAKTCPHCGIKSPGVKAGDALKGFILIFFVIFIFVQCSGSDDSSPTASTPQISDAECKQSLQCWGEKNIINAGAYCQKPIEKMSQYTFEWTDGMLDPRFSHYKWKDQSKGYITYIGDKIKLQNGFGAWGNYIYECDFDPSKNLALDVRASQGRL